jgi:hypothetical protein
MEYTCFDTDNPECIHVVLSDRAYAAIVADVAIHGENETGSVLIGNIWNRVWYIVDIIDGGLVTTNRVDYFVWDTRYVNHCSDVRSRIYKFPLSILGICHRHPGSMDYFSFTDEKTISENLKHCKHGLLSMLVNIDPEFRMTFFYCFGNKMMAVQYDVGDEYFPEEILALASPDELVERFAKVPFQIKPHRVMDPDKMPKHVILPVRQPATMPVQEADEKLETPTIDTEEMFEDETEAKETAIIEVAIPVSGSNNDTTTVVDVPSTDQEDDVTEELDNDTVEEEGVDDNAQ